MELYWCEIRNYEELTGVAGFCMVFAPATSVIKVF